MEERSLRTLVDEALVHLKNAGYTAGTVRNYRGWWNGLIAFAQANEWTMRCTTELVNAYLETRGITDAPGESLCSNQRNVRLAMRVLKEFALHGVIGRRRHAALSPYNKHWKQYMDIYIASCTEGRRSPLRSLRNRVLMLHHFFHFLDSRNISELRQIKASTLEAFVAKQTHLRPRTISNQLSHLRSFLAHLCVTGEIEPEIVDQVPKIRIYRDDRLPTVWSHDDVQRLLAAVDRTSPVGKRDYAILTLAARLGLRAGDIRTLRLDDIDWESNSIHIVQGKTGQRLDQPFPTNVGEALVDYLKNARPVSKFRQVFLRVNAPHEPLSARNAFYDLVARYRRLAGLKLPRESRKGLHALRHSLASRMLEAKISIDIIAGTLGHASPETTRAYLRVDIESLRCVAIDPMEDYTNDAV
jgi:integrase/recombinase XerD